LIRAASKGDGLVSSPVSLPEDLLTDTPENLYTARVAESHRKQLGQFFTPPPVAEFMARWIVGATGCQSILDPAIGLGAFFRAIIKLDRKNKYKFTGYDIDPTVLAEAERLFQGLPGVNVELKNEDYLFNDWRGRYDAIICNPPYFKFQSYKNRAAILKEFRERLGLSLSGMTNIYTMFILKSVHQLTRGGRAAYIVPSEFLNSDYGTAVKKRLLEDGALRYVVLFDTSENVFSDALTTCSILLFANDRFERVKFINVGKVQGLGALSKRLQDYPDEMGRGRAVDYSGLDPDVKWRAYYQDQNREKYRNLVPLATYAKVVRGIATGDNDYFTFDEKKKTKYAIGDKHLLPCLTKAAQAPASFFTQADFDELRMRGGRVFLFNAGDLSDKAVRRYIARGEQSGASSRYLTRHRRPWHALENRPPAPLLVTVFNRAGPRFVRNEAGVRNLTCFHSVYLNMLALSRIDILTAYFLTGVARNIIDDNRREYGGGLNKFEPNDLNGARVVDLDAIDGTAESAIREAYEIYRRSVLRSEPDAKALERLNALFSELLTG
jgi:adenine-specific DNA-methyltransferase